MKLLILVCLGCLFAAGTASEIEEFLKSDPAPILKDEAKWKVVFECLMDRGPCDEYQTVKDTLPKLVATKCEGCNPEQKEQFDQILKLFLDKYPEDYAELTTKLLPKPE